MQDALERLNRPETSEKLQENRDKDRDETAPSGDSRQPEILAPPSLDPFRGQTWVACSLQARADKDDVDPAGRQDSANDEQLRNEHRRLL